MSIDLDRTACHEHSRNGEGPQGVPDGVPVPHIERDISDRIHVGAGAMLIVPREDVSMDIDIGSDLDLAAMQAKKIRKPGRREFIAMNRASELPTRLLLHKPKPDAIETEYYYVIPSLRAPILSELKECRVFVFHSSVTKTFALWIVHVTPENNWYESLQILFQQPPEFFERNLIRVISDKPNSVYRVKFKPSLESVVWPSKSTDVLLGEALGADKFITSADHPLYRDLTDGIELS